MKTGFLITARLKSERLPKKLLLEVNGEAYIRWMIRRLKLATSLEEIVLCTSTNPQDDPLETVAKEEGVACFRGSEDDVIQRLYDASLKYQLDYVVNMTADCPLLPYDLIDDLIECYNKTDADLVKCHHLPVGIYLSGLKPEAMKRLLELKASGNTEYWLYYFLKTDLFKVEQLSTPSHWNKPEYRLALDYPEDHEVFKIVYEDLGPDAYKVSTSDLIQWLDDHPEVLAINRDCGRKGLERTEQDPASKVKLKSGRVLE